MLIGRLKGSIIVEGLLYGLWGMEIRDKTCCRCLYHFVISLYQRVGLDDSIHDKGLNEYIKLFPFSGCFTSKISCNYRYRPYRYSLTINPWI